MHKPKQRLLTGALLSVFLFVTLAPTTFADATNRDEGFYDQTYEINNSHPSSDGSSQISSSSGAYSFSLPLAVPNGRNGMQPSLALSYNSQSNEWDSFYGAGWSLGIPSITRINKTGLNNLYDETYFSSSLSGELVNETGTPYGDYATKVEDGSFLAYEFNSDDSWIVTDKSGTVYTFGADTNSRQDDSSDTTHIYRWMLEEVRDTNNNTVRYEYFKENGQIYPETIYYTGSGSTDGIFTVDFTLEARDDSSTFFNTGFDVQTDYRVSEISASVNGTERRSYALAYGMPDDTVRSLLESVTESAVSESGATSTLPATSFSYAESDKGWTETSGYTIPVYLYEDGGNSDKGVDVADVNGDGLLDFLDSIQYEGGSTEKAVYLNAGDGSGWAEDTSYTIPVYFWGTGGSYMKGTRMTDLNGDGASDILYASLESTTDVRKTYLFDEAASTWAEDTSYALPFKFNNGYMEDQGIRAIDMNGDSFPDFVQSLTHSGSTSKSMYLFDPITKTWNLAAGASIPVMFNSDGDDDEAVKLADVNGDGLVDIVESRYEDPISDNQAVYINQGDGTGWVEDTGYSIPVYFWDVGDIMMDVADMVDVNGDGLPDIVYSAESTAENAVYINQGDGTGWVEDIAYTVPVSFAEGYRTPKGVQLMDVDGDTLPDVVYSEYHGSSIKKIYLNDAVPELLETVTLSSGAITTVAYTPSTEFNNPDLPFSMNLVDSITVDDGLGNRSTTTYDYEGGAYLYEDELNRQFAGFASVTKTESGRVTETFYEQDDLALIGHPYQTDVYDDSGNLYTRTIDTWASSDLGYDNTFVYKSQSATLTYDGGSTHRDTGTAYTYDSYGNVKTVVNYGEVTASTAGTFTDVTTLDEKTTVTYTYATDGSGGEIRNKVSEEKITNSAGTVLKKTRYFYDSTTSYGTVSIGNLTRQADWYDITNTWFNAYYTYNSYGLVATAKNRRGYITSFSYDSYNLYPAVTTNPKAYTVSTSYDYATGQMTSRTDENGITSASSYDGFGRVLTVSVPDPTTGTLTTLSTTSYDDSSVPSSITTTSTVGGIGSESVSYMDGYGRTVQSNTLAEGGVYTTVDTWYDEVGNVEQQSLPYETSSSAYGRDDSQYSVTSSYDALNRPITVTSPTGSTSYDYSKWENTVTDANGISKVYNYDASGHLIQVEEQNDGATYTSVYSYDPLGELITLTDAQGNVRNFDYDSLGRKISQQDLHDATETSFGTWTYTYDQNNNLATQTDPAGQVITWSYDQLDRVLYEDWDMSTTARDFNYIYDTATRGKMRVQRINSNSNDSTIIYNTYDYLGNPSKETRNFLRPGLTTFYSYIFQTTYDLLSRPTKIIYPSSALTVNYTYNETGALEKVTRGTSTLSNVISDLDYSPMGQIAEETYGNGMVTSNIYDPAESYRLTNKYTTGTYSGTAGSIQNLAYSYDSVGNITGIADTSITPTAKTLTYTYDDLNRLTQTNSSENQTGVDYVETYAYDEVGNMTSKSDVGTMVYSGTGAGGTNPHAVTSVDGTAYTYDSNGNLTSNGAHSYTWDKRNRLASSSSKTFSYDASGSRYKIKDSSSGTDEYTYYMPLEELRGGTSSSAGTPTYYIFAGGQRVASLEGTVYTYYHQDHLGGTAVATDSSGEVSEYYDYYSYGSELTSTQLASTAADHTFTDKELDDDLGLYYFEARWYDSEIGRFSSQDPAQLDDRVFKILADPQSLNFYAYSRNNPVNLTDSSGEILDVLLDIGFIVLDAVTLVHDEVSNNGSNRTVNIAALGADTAAAFVPFVTGAGMVVRGANAADNIYDATRTLDNITDGVTQIAGQTNWGKADTLMDHFGRHGGDFGSKNASEYASSANDFYNKGITGADGISIKTSDNGVTKMYDSNTNTFASYNADGSTKTYFKPEKGAEYWSEQ